MKGSEYKIQTRYIIINTRSIAVMGTSTNPDKYHHMIRAIFEVGHHCENHLENPDVLNGYAKSFL